MSSQDLQNCNLKTHSTPPIRKAMQCEKGILTASECQSACEGPFCGGAIFLQSAPNEQHNRTGNQLNYPQHIPSIKQREFNDKSVTCCARMHRHAHSSANWGSGHRGADVRPLFESASMGIDDLNSVEPFRVRQDACSRCPQPQPT